VGYTTSPVLKTRSGSAGNGLIRRADGFGGEVRDMLCDSDLDAHERSDANAPGTHVLEVRGLEARRHGNLSVVRASLQSRQFIGGA
jgi:hypothetical protein